MARVRSLAGYPIEQYTSPNGGGRMSDHRGSVLHIAEGTYRGTISWQLNANQRYRDGTKVTTCSTWVVGRAWAEWAQMLDTDEIAWCQRDGSRTWLSIELAGFAPGKPTAWQIEAAAQLFAWDHRTYGTPLQVAEHDGERGLGHHSMDREWLGIDWGHEACPGSGVIGAKAAIVARAREIEEGDMALSDEDLAKIEARVERAVWDKRIWSPSLGVEPPGPTVGDWWIKGGQTTAAELSQVRVTLAGIAAAVSGEDIVAAVRAELAAWGPALAAQLAPLLAEELAGVPAEQVEAAVVRALARTRLAVT